MKSVTRIDIDHLPPRAREIADLVGTQGALALAEYRGGRWMYVPRDIDADHPLARRLGLARARRFCKVFGGERLMVPACAAALRAIRDDEIYRRHYDDGESLDSLAAAYGISQRSVLRALERVRGREECDAAAARQMSIV